MKKNNPYQLSLEEYKKLFKNEYKLLCLFANGYIADMETSKDIVQNVFIKIWEDNVVFNNEYATKSYLYVSVKNKSLDYLKSKHYRTVDNVSNTIMEEMATNSFFMREVVILETSDIIEKAINTLPHKCAQIIRLSAKSLTNSEIAVMLNISINTVKSQKKIAYRRLKPILKEHFVFVLFFLQ